MARDCTNTVTLDILFEVDQASAEGMVPQFALKVDDEGGEDWVERETWVRRFTKADLKQCLSHRAKVAPTLSIPKVRQALRFVALILAIKEKDELASQKALAALMTEDGTGTYHWVGMMEILLKSLPPGNSTGMLVREVSQHLEPVRLGIWSRKDNLAPAILCSNRETALLVHVIMRALGGETSLRLCPKCGQIFLQKRADQDFCSLGCREAHRVQRWRASKAKKAELEAVATDGRGHS